MTLGGVSQAERKKRAKEALISVGLKDKINKKPNELSGGQMQRVSIARALAGQPDIILADEPTGALDTDTSESVMKLLKEISKTKLGIMVTHNPDLAYKYSDRIIKMLDGKIIDDSDVYTAYSEEMSEIKYEDIIGKEFRIVFNDGWYTQNADGWFAPANISNYANAYDSEHGITVKIISVLRENADAADSWLGNGIAYSPALTQTILSSNKDSAVAIAQAANTTVDVTTGKTFEQDEQSGSTLPRPGGALLEKSDREKN